MLTVIILAYIQIVDDVSKLNPSTSKQIDRILGTSWLNYLRTIEYLNPPEPIWKTQV